MTADLELSWPCPLQTPRLLLEPLTVEHAREMAPLLADVRLHRFSGRPPPTPAELEARYARQAVGRSPDGRQLWLNWILRGREDEEVLGFVQATVTPGSEASAELAWTIGVAHQRRGYAREAASAVVDWLRTCGVGHVVAHIHPDNVASQGVARALGMKPTNVRVRGEVRWRHA